MPGRPLGVRRPPESGGHDIGWCALTLDWMAPLGEPNRLYLFGPRWHYMLGLPDDRHLVCAEADLEQRGGKQICPSLRPALLPAVSVIVPPELGEFALDGFENALPWCVAHRCKLRWWLPGGRIVLLCPPGGERHLLETTWRARSDGPRQYLPVAQPVRWALTMRPWSAPIPGRNDGCRPPDFCPGSSQPLIPSKRAVGYSVPVEERGHQWGAAATSTAKISSTGSRSR